MLYPPIEPFNVFYLQVSSIHHIYVEQVGSPLGIPIVFLHGGPGSGLDKEHRTFFNPDKFHVILLDQRGCGQSLPYGEVSENTTDDLIADLEKIRVFLRIDTWHVFGGSWGSFLALAYAQAHPLSVRSLILRGLFLGRKEELQFFYQKGASFIFPEAFEKFVHLLSTEEKKDVIGSYYRKLSDTNNAVVEHAARLWTEWEASCLKLINTQSSKEAFAKDFRILSVAKMETHYFVHSCFIKPDQLLIEAPLLENIPITLIHGRYDVICPFENAYLFKKVAPHTKLIEAPSSGHASSEVEIVKALLQTLEAIR